MGDARKTGRNSVQMGLLVLRVTTALFFLVWSLDKIINAKHTLRVFEKFYFLPLSESTSLMLGIAQTLIVLAFMAGFQKKWTTLALLAMHTVSVGSTWQHLINPYTGGPGLVFWAGVPVWAGLLLLWLMRDEDSMWSLD